MKKILAALFLIISTTAFAQKSDTVVVELAKSSRMIFVLKDKNDLEQLKQYDFQAMFDDILTRLERNDSVVVVINPATEKTIHTPKDSDTWMAPESDFYQELGKNNDDDRTYTYRIGHRRSSHSFNFDLGLSNYMEDGKFPDEEGAPYAIRPWGSWYLGVNSVQRTTLSNNFYMEWALGVSWYSFKFQNDKTLIVKDDTGVRFEEDTRDVSHIKSRLGATYINASFVPMFTAGGYKGSKRWWSYNNGFRIGAGPYVGYRIQSSTKVVYKEDGDRERDRNRDNFYMNNLRYGIRLQIGVRSTDFFFNYDMNELFATGKGPKLNAFSFGVTF